MTAVKTKLPLIHYQRLVENHRSQTDSMAELAYHIYPRYPEELGRTEIAKLLKWCKGIKPERVSRMLKDRDINRGTPLNCLPESDRKYLADDLLMGPRCYRDNKT